MDNMWRDESRKGRPHNNSTGSNKDQPPVGFEGMNYEQKRRPYRENEKDEKEVNGRDGGSINGRRRNDL